MTTQKTYDVRTHGCQMNVHDSERLAGLLETAGYVDVNSLPARAARRRRRRRLQHLRGARERRQQALRQPRPAAPGQARNPDMQIAVGGCMAQKDRGTIVERAPWVDVVFGTHNIGSPAGPARPGPPQPAAPRSRSSRASRSSRRTLPTRRDSRLQRLGLDLGRLQQHLHVLHRAEPARQGGRPPPRRRSSPRSQALVGAGRRRGHPARAERQHLRRRVRRPAGVRQAAARLRRDRGPRAGPVHQPAPGRVHRRRHRSRWPRRPTSCRACTCRCSPGSDRVLKDDAPLLPQREVPRHHRPGPRADPRRGDHHRHHRRLPRRDRGRLPGRRSTSCAQSRFSSAFTFQYSIRPGTPAATMDRPGAQGRRAGALRAAHRRPGGGLLGREPRPRGPRGRGARRHRRGPQGRRDAPPLRAAPATTGSSTSPCPRAPSAPRPATWSPSGSPTARRTTSSPTRPSRAGTYAVRRTAGGDAWAALQDAPQGTGKPASAWACRPIGRPGRGSRPSGCRPGCCGRSEPIRAAPARGSCLRLGA